MDPFIGEIRLLPYIFTPDDWLPCDGQRLPIVNYQALYTLIGINFGGDAKTYFNIPNLSGLSVVGSGQGPGLSNYNYGRTVGAPTVTLNNSSVPPHSHVVQGLAITPSTTTATHMPLATTQLTRATVAATNKLTQLYSTVAQGDATLHPSVIGPGPTSAVMASPHENRQPYLALRFCICVKNGVYPVHP